MEKIIEPLLLWFQEHKRDLPWRKNYNDYRIWISEIMLQQTRVEAVKPYYLRFIHEVPDYEALSQLPEERLFKLWEGLGYYSRARNLKKCAEIVSTKYHGQFPKDYKEALALPGIGIYTAGAILSRSYGLKLAAVDGNVLRVFTRLEENDMDILKDTTKVYYKNRIEPIMPNNPGELNEALMELGATVCMPKIALCDSCPLISFCKAHQNGTIFQYPKKKVKKEKSHLEYSVFFVTDGERYIFIPKRDGVLEGLSAPLLYESYCTIPEAYEYLEDTYSFHVMNILPLQEDKHVFSHQVWYMRAYKVIVDDLKDYPAYTKKEILENIGLPTCYRKFLDYLF